MENRIALVTCSKYPKLTESDRILASTLERAGAEVVAVDWRDGDAQWSNFDLAVLRSTWDYHLHADEFAAWIERVAAATRLVNSAALVRWNSNKRYLADLRERGVPLLPFLLVEPDGRIPFRDLDHAGWQEIVVKPLVGASAWQIIRTNASALEDAVTPELRRTGYLIQPYAREVEEGEYSVIFFEGRFSHAILKKPRTGDFRTQPELGAVLSLVQPSDSLLADAAAVLRALPDVPTYARIDGVVQNGRFVLMEAELIEPELFFRLYPAGAQTFAGSLLALTQSKGR